MTLVECASYQKYIIMFNTLRGYAPEYSRRPLTVTSDRHA